MYLSKNQAIQSFERDIDSIILGVDSLLQCPGDERSMFDIQVVSYNKGYGLLYVMLPEALIKGFVAHLEMYADIWRAAQYKLKYKKAEKKAVDPVELDKRNKVKAAYEKDLLSIFDGLMKNGIPVREALKQTKTTLKEKGYPWVDYFLVQSALSSSGRLKGTGYYGKTK